MRVPKTTRVVDRKAIAAERKPYCEVCGAQAHGEPHHIKTKGSGGHDIRENLIQLCWSCHYEKVPAAQLPKDRLFEIVARRMGLSLEEVQRRVKSGIQEL